jgi:hypothetical protein
MLIKSADLIYPTLTEFNADDYSFAPLDRKNIYSFKTLKERMIEAGYPYFLSNQKTLQDNFSIWFPETDADRVVDSFDLITEDKNIYGNVWFLYQVK